MSEARIQLDGDMSGCYCGEFDRPTIAPDEFGETCFHERDKCEVPPVPVPIETVLRLTRARAEKAEAAIARVRELHLPCTAFSVQEGGCGPGEHTVSDPPVCFHCQAAWPCPTVKALDGGKASRREPRRAETTTSEQERLI